MSRPCLVVDAETFRDVAAIAETSPPVGVVNISSQKLICRVAPVFPDLKQALSAHPVSTVVFLSPYSGLYTDMRMALETGAQVVSAGPVPCSLAAWENLTGQKTSGQGNLALPFWPAYMAPHARMAREARHPDFGQPVYYRCMSAGGSGLLAHWWTQCRMWQCAVDALGSAVESGYVAARRIGRVLQISLTLRMRNKAHAHLVTVPLLSGGRGETYLLGTGGALSDSGYDNAPRIHGVSGVRPATDDDGSGRAVLIADVFAGREVRTGPDETGWSRALLKAIRSALRTGNLTKVV